MRRGTLIIIVALFPLIALAQTTARVDSTLTEDGVGIDPAAVNESAEAHLHRDGNRIYWAKQTLEPLFFLPGQGGGQVGFGDEMLKILTEELPGYEHLEMRTNYARMLAEIRSGNPVCGILHRTPQREEFTVFSKMLAFPPTYKLYSLSENRQAFAAIDGWDKGAVALTDVLENKQGLRMAHQASHSYGKVLDAILARYHHKLEWVRGYAGQKSLVKMLLAGRVDVIVEFPWVVNYHLKEMGVDTSELYGVTLTETPAYEPAYIGCPKNAWGEHVIDHLNQMDPPLYDRMKHFLEVWLSPEEITDYRAAFEAYFNPQNSPQTEEP